MADFKAMFEEFNRIVLEKDGTSPEMLPPEPPASEEAFELLEQTLGKTPSEEMKDFYRVANGGWLYGDRWESIERIIEVDPEVEQANQMREGISHPLALPLAARDTLHIMDERAGNGLALSLAGPTKGQIVDYGEFFIAMFSSFEAYVELYLDAARQGVYTVFPGFCAMRDRDVPGVAEIMVEFYESRGYDLLARRMR